jgi:hypothetical protein
MMSGMDKDDLVAFESRQAEAAAASAGDSGHQSEIGRLQVRRALLTPSHPRRSLTC